MSNEDFSLELEIGSSSASEALYEVEKILDRKSDRGGFSYLVKWENFPESQATWETEDNLESVQWMIQEFNAKFEKSKIVRKKIEREKLSKLSEKRRKMEKKKKSSDSLEFRNQLDELEEETSDFPRKSAKMTSEISSEDTKKASIEKTKLALQQLVLKEISLDVRIPMATGKMVRGNLALDVAVKILGCRKQGKTVLYAVLFKKRSDEGVVVIPQVCTHEELKVQAPWLLSQYLLDYARTDQVA